MKKTVFLLCLLNVFLIKAQDFTEYQDQKVNRVNCEPFRAYFIPHANEQSALSQKREQSDNFYLLNGKWKLNWVKDVKQRPEDFYTLDFNDSSWKEEVVPCNVEMQGYGEPIYTNTRYVFPVNLPVTDRGEKGNPVISYRKSFTLPEGWKDKKVTIHFNGVQSCLYLWLNGSYVGFHEDAMSTAEFDLTPYLKDGENVLAAQVMRWSDGSYLEDQDMWWLSGIYRDVYLMAEPKLHINDFKIVTDLDASFTQANLKVDYSILNNGDKKDKAHSVQFKMYDRENKLVFSAKQLCNTQLKEGEKADFYFREMVLNPNLWSAEDPYLYRLTMTLLSKSDRELESICQEIGFRKVEILGGLMMLNGQKIYIKGVNHHDQNPETGRYMPLEMIEKDLILMKQYNLNAVRTSHYPKTPQFYELCNRIGIYVWDEANNESHGAFRGGRNLIANDESWQQAFIERGMAMVQRDKNQPSVLVWSMGNECGGPAGDGVHSNFFALADSIRKADPTRPVHYEGHGTDFDIIAYMYISVEALKNSYNNWPEKPVILCEYVHAMGNSGGGVRDYWDTFYQYDRMQGGFVWDWADQGLKTVKDGKTFFANGWDRGKGDPNDGDFCFNGLVSPDRKPHGQFYEMKIAYQPAVMFPVDIRNGVINVRNTLSFTNLSEYDCVWELQKEGDVIENGTMTLDVRPLESDNFRIPFSVNLADEKAQYFLNVRLKEKKNHQWASKGHEVAYQQFIVTPIPAKKIIPADTKTVLKAEQTPDLIKVKAGEVTYGFSKKTGTLSSMVVKGKERMVKPSRPNFARPSTSNERKHFAEWQKNGFWDTEATLINMRVMEEGIEPMKIMSSMVLSGNTNINVLYSVFSNGEIQIATSVTPEQELFIGKIGWQFYLDKGMQNIDWLGNELETYRDRDLAGLVKGNYDKKVADLWMEYEVPQENGNRSDVRWVTMTDGSKAGFFADADEPFNISAYPYEDVDIYRAGHPCYLTERDYVTFNLDYETQGVGTAACGPDVLQKYRVYLRPVKFMFRMRPFDKAKDQTAVVYQQRKTAPPFNVILGGAGVQQDDVPINEKIVIQNINSGKLMTAEKDGRVIQWEKDINRIQTFRFEPMSFGFFRIVDPESGKVIALRKRTRESGMDIELQDYEGGDYQLWSLTGGRGGIKVINKWANKLLDVNGAHKNNGEKLIIWDATGGDNQHWVIYKQTAQAPTAAKQSISLLSNYGFEEKGSGIPGWNILALTGNDSFASIEYGGYNGTSKFMKLHSSAEYRGYVYQRVKELEDGDYEVTAMVRSTGGQQECFFTAFSGTAPAKQIQITASPSWKQISLKVKVVDGRCEVGFFTAATAKQSLSIDNVILKKVK